MRRNNRRPTRVSAGKPQNPLQIYGSNLVLWFASDRGITQSGGLVSLVKDQSNSAREAFQTTEANKPTYTTAEVKLNNMPAIIFNASHWLTVSHFADGNVSSNGLAAYIIGSFPASAPAKQLLGKWTSWGVNQSSASDQDYPSALAWTGATVYAHSGTAPIDDGEVHLIRFLASDSTHVAIDVDGGAVTTSEHAGYEASTNPLIIGSLSTPTITGAVLSLGEFVLVKTNPSAQQDYQTRLWMNSRYG